jgi:hypothetical protein
VQALAHGVADIKPVTITVKLAGFYELRPYPPPGS